MKTNFLGEVGVDYKAFIEGWKSDSLKLALVGAEYSCLLF